MVHLVHQMSQGCLSCSSPRVLLQVKPERDSGCGQISQISKEVPDNHEKLPKRYKINNSAGTIQVKLQLLGAVNGRVTNSRLVGLVA